MYVSNVSLHPPAESFLPTEAAEEEEVLPPGGWSHRPHHPHHHHCCFSEKMRLSVVRFICLVHIGLSTFQ